MKAKYSLLLFVLGLVISSLGAQWIRSPGFMDADYYYATALQLSRGEGLTEPFLWNYLDDPAGLPHPSHLYWMPLSSTLAAPFIVLIGESFRSAQLPFIILASLLPLLTAHIAYELSSQLEKALFAGMLALFPGFFFPFLLTTDAFALYGLIGAATFLLVARLMRHPSVPGWFGVGCLVALGHLTRADGVLLFLPVMLGLYTSGNRGWRSWSALVLGYLVLFTPWMLRNYAVAGSLLSPGGLKSLWMLEYNELFSFPSDLLNSTRWFEAGVGSFLQARFDAGLQNLQSVLAVNGLVFLLPFMGIGLYRMRERPLVRITLIYWAALLVVMSLMFPFVGARGAYFHSSTALMPVLWAVVPIGLEIALEWVSTKRGWSQPAAYTVFRTGMILGVFVFTLSLFVGRVVVKDESGLGWNRSDLAYEMITKRFSERIDQGDLVLVNNPPGYYLASGVPAIVIPHGNPETLRAVAERYSANWLILEENHPAGMETLFAQPESLPWIQLEDQLTEGIPGRVLLYRIIEVSER